MACVEQVQITTGAARRCGSCSCSPPSLARTPLVVGTTVLSDLPGGTESTRHGGPLVHEQAAGLVDRNTRLILLNRPHNPTGAVVSDADLDRLHALATERGIQLVVDEVFHPIYHGPRRHSATRLAGATVVGDFSKALCLSGLRLGWIVERDPIA